MGSFGGHVLPGSFYVTFALWHLWQICIRYFNSVRPNGPPFKSHTYFLSRCCPRIPLESFLKITATTVGIAGEVFTGIRHGHFVAFGNLQHITMFGFFGMTALLELLHHYNFFLPPNILYLSTVMAFFVEALLFYWHLHGRLPMDVQVHTLLLYVIVATVICIFLEMYYRYSVLPCLCRSYLILLQGCWFLQVAFILYPPSGFEKWDLKSHEQMMIVTIIFCAWSAICLAVVCSIWWLVFCHRGMCKRSSFDLDVAVHASQMVEKKVRFFNELTSTKKGSPILAAEEREQLISVQLHSDSDGEV